MKAWRLADSSREPTFVDEIVPQPQPGNGELLIRVRAAGVTPTEVLWYPTSHTKSGEQRSRAIPGHEFSGVVAALGEGTSGFEVGQEVYGMNDWFSDGAMAEYCVTQPSSIAAKPRRMSHVEAASVPIGGLTAWQGLFERARLQPGEHVLVHGGAGSVGLFAIQLARFHAAHVITTASARNAEFLSRLGVQQVIDYRATRFEESVHDVDVVFDTVGGETLDRSWSVLKPGGRMITIAADGERASNDRAKEAFFIVEPNGKQLTQIGDLIEAEKLRPFVDAVLPFDEASAAYTGRVVHREGRGKLVIAVAAD